MLDNLVLTEQIRLRDSNTLEDRITINDSVNFTHPWEAVIAYKRQPADSFPFPEDVCMDRLHAGQPPITR